MDRLKNAMLKWCNCPTGEDHTFGELTAQGRSRIYDADEFCQRFMPIAAVKLDTAQTRIAELEQAIREHRGVILEEDVKMFESDKTLWSVLED